MISRIACTGKYVHQVVLIATVDGAAHLSKVAHNLIEYTENGFAVGQGYIAPHNRVAGGYTGKVAEASGGKAKYFAVIAHTGQCIDQ